ncbi:hypothetical protein BDZ97DRAFT_1772096 [Flammula alnicola]|nr:hypothetical protein BDZ97DRAFT_1772096 [Flammula alnicola]
MSSTSADHFALIRAFIKQTAKVFISCRSSNTHPPADEIRTALETIQDPLLQHLRRFPDDPIECESFRAFLTSLSVAAYQLPFRPSSWNVWLIQNTPNNLQLFQTNNQFFRTSILPPNYVYVGDPGEDEDDDAEGSNDSDSAPEVPSASVSRTGPPTKRPRIEPPAVPSRREAPPSPVPSVSTRSRPRQAKASSRSQPTIPPKSVAAPKVAAPPSSQVRTTSVRATSPVAKMVPSTSSAPRARQASSVIELDDSEEEQVDELEDDQLFEPVPKASKGKTKAKTTKALLPREVAAQKTLAAPGPAHKQAIPSSMVNITVPAPEPNPGRCLACSTHLFKGEPHECKFLGWGRRCEQCQKGGKSRCTFELKPEELDEVLQSISPLTTSSRDQLRILLVQINRLLQDGALFSQLADRANRNAAALILQLLDRANYLKSNFPPGHIVGPRFQDMDVLDVLLSCDPSIPEAYFDESATDRGFPPMSTLKRIFAGPSADSSSTANAFDAVNTAVKTFHTVESSVAEEHSSSRAVTSPANVKSPLPDTEPRGQDGDHEDHPDDMETDEQ